MHQSSQIHAWTKILTNLIKNNDLPEKFIILRHDCERDLSKAYKLAKIENKLQESNAILI